jgi:hypothetical protein
MIFNPADPDCENDEILGISLPFRSVREASVGENAVDSAVNHGGMPRRGKVI